MLMLFTEVVLVDISEILYEISMGRKGKLS